MSWANNRFTSIPLGWWRAAACILWRYCPPHCFGGTYCAHWGRMSASRRRFCAYYVGNIGKYVPGKALVIILRAGLIRSHRVDTSVATVSIFVETLTLMASGSCLAAVTLLVWHPEHWWYAVAALGMMLVVGLPTVPPIFRWVLHWTNRTRATTVPRSQLQRLGYATLAVGWLAGCTTWTLMALSQWASLRALGVDTQLLTDLPLCVSIVTLSTVAGFLSFIPGGFGVRDIVMTQIAAPRFGPANGLASALLVRLTWLVAELGISAILYLIPWGPRATPPTDGDHAVTIWLAGPHSSCPAA